MRKFIQFASFLLFSTICFGQVQLIGDAQISGQATLTCQAPPPSCATPVASPSAGSYSSPQTVNLTTATSGATICYTLNGTAPSASVAGTCDAGSTTYTGAISVNSSLTIFALATKSGMVNSSTLSAPYTIGSGLPVFSPAPGTYSGPQTVTISCSGGKTPFYTTATDGSPATIASIEYTGPFTVSSSQTIGAICATLGAYQTNTQANSAATNCYTVSGGTWGSTTCGSSEGVGTVNPSSVTITVGNPASYSLTAPPNTSSEVELLVNRLYGGNAVPSAPTCDSCTKEVQDITIEPTVGNSVVASHEFDMPQFDHTHGINRQNGMQCNQKAGTLQFQVDSGNLQPPATTWVNTGIACNFPANIKQHLIVEVSHVNGDTGCGGHGCANYTDLYQNGTHYALGGNYSGTQGYSTTSDKAWGPQNQIDMQPTGSSAISSSLTILSSTVALGYGDESAQVNATYTIGAGTASPVLLPNTGHVGNNAIARSTPTLAFGSQGTHTSSPAIPISISNLSNVQYCSTFGIGCGTGSMTVTSMAISGSNASDFALSGSCGAIVSGSDCEPTITFTPTASNGTNETATLTVNYSGANVSSQTMALTGTSATVTSLSSSSCPSALSSSTTYQLTANLTCAGTVFTVSGTGTNINLNGHTITYGNASSASQVNAIQINGFNAQLNVYNGNISSGAGANTFGPGHPQSSAIGYTGSYNLSPTSASNFFNLTFNLGIQYANAIEDNNGLVVVHDNVFNNTAVGTCASVGCRDEYFAAAIYQENVSSVTSGSTQVYNNTVNGGPQGGFQLSAPDTSIDHNFINSGNASGGNSNDFGIYQQENGPTYDNVVLTPLTSGSNSRGILTSAAQGDPTGANIHNNIVQSVELPVNSEYSGCQSGGAYGEQVDDNPVGPTTINGNWVEAYAKTCAASALRITDSEYTTNISENSTYIGTRQTGATVCVPLPDTAVQPGCAYGVAMDGPTGFTSTGDTFSGDSGDVLFDVDGGTGVTFQSPTFEKGSNPSGFNTFVSSNGTNSQGGAPVSNIHFVDPTYMTGTSPTDINFPAQSSVMGHVEIYPADWTQMMTVTKASGPAASGAVVTFTDTLGNHYTCTTNSSGVCSVPVSQYRDNNDTGANQVENRNPYSLTVALTGCTTNSQTGLTITATTSRPITLSGC